MRLFAGTRGKRQGLLAIATVLTLPGACTATPSDGGDSTDAETVRGEIGRSLDAYLRVAMLGGFSGVVLVEREGGIVLHKAYGWADRSGGVPNTIRTAFNVASVTKPSVATVVALDVAAGRLSYQDSLARFFRDVPLDKRGITIHQLLTHTSGLGNSYLGESTVDHLEGARRVLDAPLIHAVGSEWDYSNDGYFLLGVIAEVVNGAPIHTLIRNRLLAPAGMLHTAFPDDSLPWNARDIAHGEDLLTAFDAPVLAVRDSSVARSFLTTTAGDLYRWERASRGERIVPFAVRDTMRQARVPIRDGVSHGYGWMVWRTAGGDAIRYGGNQTPGGFTSEYRTYPAARAFAVILNNSMWNGTDFLHDIRTSIEACLFATCPDTAPVDSLSTAQSDRLVGTYGLAGGGRLVVWRTAGATLLGAEGQDAVDALMPGNDSSRAARLAASQRTEMRLREPLGRMQAGGVRQRLEALVARHGPLLRWEIVGSAPTEPEAITTFARLTFERGTETMRFVWNDDQLNLVLDGTSRPYLPLVAHADGSIAAFDFLLGTMTFVSAAEGAPAPSISIGGMGGQVTAARMSR